MAIPGKSDHDVGGMLIRECGFPSELRTLSKKYIQRSRKEQLCIL